MEENNFERASETILGIYRKKYTNDPNLENLLDRHAEKLRQIGNLPENQHKGFVQLFVALNAVKFEREITFADLTAVYESMSSLQRSTPLYIEDEKKPTKRNKGAVASKVKDEEDIRSSDIGDTGQSDSGNLPSVEQESEELDEGPAGDGHVSSDDDEDPIGEKPKSLVEKESSDKEEVSTSDRNMSSDENGTSAPTEQETLGQSAKRTTTPADQQSSDEDDDLIQRRNGILQEFSCDPDTLCLSVPYSKALNNALDESRKDADNSSTCDAAECGKDTDNFPTSFAAECGKDTDNFPTSYAAECGNDLDDPFTPDEDDEEYSDDLFEEDDVDQQPDTLISLQTLLVEERGFSTWSQWIDHFRNIELRYICIQDEVIKVLCTAHKDNDERKNAIETIMGKWYDIKEIIDPLVRELDRIAYVDRMNDFVKLSEPDLHEWIQLRYEHVPSVLYDTYFDDYEFFQSQIGRIVEMLDAPTPPQCNTRNFLVMWNDYQTNRGKNSTHVQSEAESTGKKRKDTPFQVLTMQPIIQFRNKVKRFIERKIINDDKGDFYHPYSDDIFESMQDFIKVVLSSPDGYKKTCFLRFLKFVKRLRAPGYQPTTGTIEGRRYLSDVPFWGGMDKTRNVEFFCIILGLIADENELRHPLSYTRTASSFTLHDFTPEGIVANSNYFDALIGGNLGDMVHVQLMEMRKDPAYSPTRALRILLTLYYIGGCRLISRENCVLISIKCVHKLTHILRLTDDIVADQDHITKLINSLQKDQEFKKNYLSISSACIDEGFLALKVHNTNDREGPTGLTGKGFTGKHPEKGKPKGKDDPERDEIERILSIAFNAIPNKSIIPRENVLIARFGVIRGSEERKEQPNPPKTKPRSAKPVVSNAPPIEEDESIPRTKTLTVADLKIHHRKLERENWLREKREQRRKMNERVVFKPYIRDTIDASYDREKYLQNQARLTTEALLHMQKDAESMVSDIGQTTEDGQPDSEDNGQPDSEDDGKPITNTSLSVKKASANVGKPTRGRQKKRKRG